MITQIFAVPLNPEPWKVPPAYGGRNKGGGVYAKFGQDPGNKAFQDAVKEELEIREAYMMAPEYSLDIFTWRELTQYRKSEKGRLQTKKRSDATNMQKLIEDALKGVVFEDDDTVIDIHTAQVHQAISARPMVVIVARGELESGVFGHGDDQWLWRVPADVRMEVEAAYTQARIRQNQLGDNASRISESNKW
ncbi:RusA-like resolvase [Gordonia phage Camerico]|nr:RusA-like resolvase [Gordonia phage Camerico]